MEKLIENLEITLEKKKGSIKPDDEFRQYLEWDSLMVFAMLSMISDEYNTTITRAQYEDIRTVRDLHNFLSTN